MQSERGVALFLALILVSTLSVLTVSLMFLAQSESFASGNYRLMTQARYGAEAGVQKAADFILNTDFGATAPGLMALLPSSQSPIQYNLKDVVLSSDPDPTHQPNFPDAAVQALFLGATGGQVVAGTTTVHYTAYATLISMHQIQDGYTGVTKVVQTWQITSTATLDGVRKSQVQVSALLDSDEVPTIAFAAYGTDPGCNSLFFKGNVSTNSYDSNVPMLPLQTTPTLYDTGGDVGTNGNLDIQGSVDVKGNLSSPITGVGSCSNNGNGVASVALTKSSNATVEGGAPLQMPQTLYLPTPPIPNPTAPPGPFALTNASGACGTLGLTLGLNCFENSVTNTLTLVNQGPGPMPLPYIQMSGNLNLVLTASTTLANNAYNFNALSVGSAQNTVKIESPSSDYGVKINISGTYPDGTAIPTVLDIAGGADVGGFVTATTNGVLYPCTLCNQFDASLTEFIYGGTGIMNVTGNATAGVVYYAPNATVNFSGTSALYGAVIGKTLAINGGGGNKNVSINYDQSLAGKGKTASAPMLASFSWKKY